MRIIDNKHDFYDYLQDSTDKLVFDRRGSFQLTKEKFCFTLSFVRWYQESNYRFVLLQCGATFWLFMVTVTEFDDWHRPTNYNIEVLDTWKNYDTPNELLKMDLISFKSFYGIRDYKVNDFVPELVKAHIADLRAAIDHNDIWEEHKINQYTKVTDCKNGFKREEQSIPLLAPCGIGNIISPTEMFCAIEEYFSIEKTKSETTEAKGATNDDKIIMHGFDTKISFRGK